MEPAPQKKRGRPPKFAGEKTRGNLTIRIRDRVREDLESVAANAGRSLSEEIEYRLEASLRDRELLGEAMQMAYGADGAALLTIMGEIIRAVRTLPAFFQGHDPERPHDWMDDGFAFLEFQYGFFAILDALRPQPMSAPASLEMVTSDYGRRVAEKILDRIKQGDRQFARIREQLGLKLEAAHRRRKDEVLEEIGGVGTKRHSAESIDPTEAAFRAVRHVVNEPPHTGAKRRRPSGGSK